MQHARTLALILILACLMAYACAGDAIQPLPYVEGSWTLVVMPDTQYYSEYYPATLTSQTQWAVHNVASRNIPFVLTEGDITDDNTAVQWTNVKSSFSLLDGVIPYAIVLGNHDYYGSSAHDTSPANTFFPPALVKSSPAYGGVYERNKLDNAYYLFSAGGRDWLVLSLEFGARDGAISWANKVLDMYPRRSVIISTHAYLFYDGTRYDYNGDVKQIWAPYDFIGVGANDGEQIWQKLIVKHKNVAFVFCGHVLAAGAARLTSIGAAGNKVHQILANYQMRAQGGEGYMRLVEFLPDGKTVQVKTYSPLLDKYLTDPLQQFTLDLPPAP